MTSRPDSALQDVSTLEAEIRVPGMVAQVGSYNWDSELETTPVLPDHTLAMLMSPRHRTSQGSYVQAGGGQGFVDIGDMIFVPAELPFRARASGGPIRFVRCCYAPSRFEDLTGLSDWTPETLNNLLDIRDPRLHETMIRLAHEVLTRGFGAEALVEGLALTAAIDLARHINSFTQPPAIVAGGLAPWQLRRIRRYVNGNPGARADLEALAALCGISSRHLRRLFKQTTKQTLHEYIRDSWVAKAKTLLCQTDLPLKEIAAQLGLTDAGGFSIAFRRATGAAPRTFRQQFAKGGFVARQTRTRPALDQPGLDQPSID